MSVTEITNWERKNGQVPDLQSCLCERGGGGSGRTGKIILGSDVPKDTANLHFPGLSREAAEFLARERKVDGVGIDTASIDPGQSRDFIAHQILNGADIYGLENVANLDKVPLRAPHLSRFQ